MDGVIVLNVVERTRLPDWALICILLCVFAMAVFFIELLTGDTQKKINISGIGFACTLILIFIFLVVGQTVASKRIMQYECTIDSNVSFVELCEKYDVIEQRGDIWVLEEKTNGEVD